MLIDKHATLQCLGCIMKKPSLLEEYTLTQYDFEEEQFYAILFSSPSRKSRSWETTISVPSKAIRAERD